MRGNYLRPVGLSYGDEARAAVSQGRAGPLGGSGWIAFHAAEVIGREGSAITREIAAYGDLRGHQCLAAIEAPRAEIAGQSLARPLVMGIVNVTPDSFSDGGNAEREADAVAQGLRLAAEGAHILDVGGESTRPGSDGIDTETELARVLPVIGQLASAGHVVSCDTRKAAVMEKTVAAGARLINDVSALGHDPAGLQTVAVLGCPVVLMHAQGDPRTMQLSPRYDDVALDVYDVLAGRIAACEAAGIPRSRIIADPGIGFGKTFRHNVDLLHQIALFHGLGVALLAGLSRKAFVGALTGEKVAANRGIGSAGGAVHAILNGVHIIRVHDVKSTVAALAVALASADPAASGL
jgi:dihydropteroate synthase